MPVEIYRAAPAAYRQKNISKHPPAEPVAIHMRAMPSVLRTRVKRVNNTTDASQNHCAIRLQAIPPSSPLYARGALRGERFAMQYAVWRARGLSPGASVRNGGMLSQSEAGGIVCPLCVKGGGPKDRGDRSVPVHRQQALLNHSSNEWFYTTKKAPGGAPLCYPNKFKTGSARKSDG